MPNQQVLDVDSLLVHKSMEDALEKRPVFVAMDPMFVYTRFHWFEFEAGIGMKGMRMFMMIPAPWLIGNDE